MSGSSSGGPMRLVRTIVPSFLRRRFVYKLAMWMLVVVVLVALVGGVGYIRAQETVTDNTEQQMKSTASLQADSIDDWIDQKERQTESMASDESMSGSQNDAQFHIDTTLPTLDATAVNIHVVNASTDMVMATTTHWTSDEGLDDLDEPWADPSMYDEESPSSYDARMGETAYQSEYTQNHVYFVAPVVGAEERYVVLEGNLDSRIRMLGQPYGDDQNTALVATNTGEVLSGDADLVPSGIKSGETTVDEENGTWVEEGGHVTGAVSLDGANWVLATTVPEGTAFETAEIVGETMLIVVGAALISVLGVAIVIGRGTAVPITRLRNKARTMEEGDLDVDLQTGRIDEIGQLYDGFGAMRDTLKEEIQAVQEARESAERTSEHLEYKADEYSQVMRQCAEGDLTQRMNPESENEAMREIAEEFNQMITAIEETITHVTGFATEVATASEEVTASSEEVRNASEQVSTSIQQIADGAEQQHGQLAEVTTEINTLSSATEEIASLSNEVAEIAERTAETGAEGRDAANEAAEDMTAVATETNAVVEQFERLADEIEQIDELTTFIEEVAQRTNMLALNANIEASRSADSGGEGFGVVAREVKELSEETQEATDSIQEQLTTLQEEADEAAAMVERTSDQVSDSVGSVRDAVEALEDIATYAERTNRGVQEISTATDDQASAANEAAGMVDDVAEISRKTTEESESVAASAEEQTSALTEVSKNASGLAEQAAQLSAVLDQFETDVAVERDSLVEGEHVDETAVEFDETVATEEANAEPVDDGETEPAGTGGDVPAEPAEPVEPVDGNEASGDDVDETFRFPGESADDDPSRTERQE